MSITADPLTSDPLELGDWSLTYRSACGELAHREALLATSNGSLGVTGGGFWGEAGGRTYLNGLFEAWEIKYAEDAFGMARQGQSRIEAQRLGPLVLRAEGVALGDAVAKLAREERLDYRLGELAAATTWRLPSGVTLTLTAKRVVSLEDPGRLVQSYLIIADGPVQLEGVIGFEAPAAHSVTETSDELDPRRNRAFSPASFPVLETGACADEFWESRATEVSRLGVAAAAAIELSGAHLLQSTKKAPRIGFAADLDAGGSVELNVFVAVSLVDGVPTAEQLDSVRGRARESRSTGLAEIERAQSAALDRYWEAANVEVEAEPGVHRALRFTGFHLAQATALLGGHGIGAKGLTGEGYEGHCFWDTEIFLVPALSLIDPARARQALEFRYRTLPLAREWAGQLQITGALFPWRTIDGHEASAYFLAGTAQRHINADIAYAVARYLDATADEDYLRNQGAEILIETARAWLSLGVWTDPGNRFEILRVTGPDEYSALVDNNLYTNAMARLNLQRAVEAVELMTLRWPAQWIDLAARLDWSEGEALEWKAAAASMKIGYDVERGIHPQDDGFLSLQPIDLADPGWQRPFLLHYHPLFIYSHQILKQADVVMAMNLLGEVFEEADKRANYLFYEPLTTGDSSLSCVGQAVAAARAGEVADALAHLDAALRLDLANTHGNTSDGLHLAAVAGSWSAVVHGFGGVEIRADRLLCHPRVPKHWGSLTFHLRWRGSLLRVTARPDEVELAVVQGAAVEVDVAGSVQLIGQEGIVVLLPIVGSSVPGGDHVASQAVAFLAPDLPVTPLMPPLPCPALPGLQVTGLGHGPQGTVVQIAVGDRQAQLGPDSQSATRRSFLLAMTVASATVAPDDAPQRAVDIADWLMELWHSADQEPIGLDAVLSDEELAWLEELDAQLSQPPR